MKRLGLMEQFHGEPNPSQEGLAADLHSHDEVALEVVKGTVSFLVPVETPDDQLHKHGQLERYVHCQLKLENGTELNLWVHEGAEGVDVRMGAPKELTALPN